MIASSLLAGSFHSPAQDTFPSMMAATEVRQGVYKEYTVEKADPLTPDQLKRTYKTADETDTSKNKVTSSFLSNPFDLYVLSIGQFWQCC